MQSREKQLFHQLSSHRYIRLGCARRTARYLLGSTETISNKPANVEVEIDCFALIVGILNNFILVLDQRTTGKSKVRRERSAS